MLGIILTALYSLAVACHRCISTDVLPATRHFRLLGARLIIHDWPKKWTLVDARDELVTDVFNVSCLFSWSPSTMGSLLRLNSTHTIPVVEVK